MSFATRLNNLPRDTNHSSNDRADTALIGDALTLPSRPTTTPQIDLGCYDHAWEILPCSHLTTQLAERREALRLGATPQPLSAEELERAIDKTTQVSTFSLREAVQAFFTWELRQHPSSPHLFPRQLTSDDTLDQLDSLTRVPRLAQHLITTGHLPEPLNHEAGEFMALDLSKRSPIAIGSPLLGGGAVACTSMALSPYLAAVTALATGIVVTRNISAALARSEYNKGYIDEVIEAERALEQGEAPSLQESVSQLLDPARSSTAANLRAEGFLIARTLRLLEVPSLVIHEAFVLNRATDIPNQALFTLLKAKLKEQNFNLRGSIVEAYEASRGDPEGLASTLNALQRCYFSWGNALRPEFQAKIHDLVVALPA